MDYHRLPDADCALTRMCSYTRPASPRQLGSRSSREFIAIPPQANTRLKQRTHTNAHKALAVQNNNLNPLMRKAPVTVCAWTTHRHQPRLVHIGLPMKGCPVAFKLANHFKKRSQVQQDDDEAHGIAILDTITLN